MNQRQALALGQATAGRIHWDPRTGATRYTPWDYRDPRGPSTEVHHAHYRAAQVSRAMSVAEIALHAMGKWTPERRANIRCSDYWRDDVTARGLLRAALAS